MQVVNIPNAKISSTEGNLPNGFFNAIKSTIETPTIAGIQAVALIFGL